jgi:hypothetical protein
VDLREGYARGEGRDTILGSPDSIDGSEYGDVLLGSKAREFLEGPYVPSLRSPQVAAPRQHLYCWRQPDGLSHWT